MHDLEKQQRARYTARRLKLLRKRLRQLPASEELDYLERRYRAKVAKRLKGGIKKLLAAHEAVRRCRSAVGSLVMVKVWRSKAC